MVIQFEVDEVRELWLTNVLENIQRTPNPELHTLNELAAWIFFRSIDPMVERDMRPPPEGVKLN